MEKLDLAEMMQRGLFNSGAKSVSYCEILDLSDTTVTVRYRTSVLGRNLAVQQKDFRVVLKTKVRQVDGMYYEIPDSAEILSIKEIPFSEFSKKGQLFKELSSRIEDGVTLRQKIRSSQNLVAMPERQKSSGRDT